MRRPLLLGALCGLLAACGSATARSTSSTASTSTPVTSSATPAPPLQASAAATIGFENVPLEVGPALAPAASTGTGAVDGISCGAIEQLAYHIHAHLAVYDTGRLYALPAGIGIPGSSPQATQDGPVAGPGRCIYWLHTHTSDGIIHIESPTRRIYTLGDFFAVWRQPLSADRIARLHGTVRAWLNGRPWHASPRAIPLLPHADIQLQIGRPAAPLMRVDWGVTQL
jgi:hypothetical protein